MSKKKIKSEAPKNIESVETALSRSEQFIEKNQKLLIGVVVGLIVIVGGYLGYRKMILEPQNEEANSQMYVAEQYFERDSFNLALNGDGNYPGFLTILDDYSSTKAGNLAQYYAGMCYLYMGKFNEAIEYLGSFDTENLSLKAEAIGCTGDAYFELKQDKKAVDYYLKAANVSEHKFLSPIYLLRAGIVLENMKDYKGALKQYNLIKEKYKNSSEGMMIEKYIAKAEILSK